MSSLPLARESGIADRQVDLVEIAELAPIATTCAALSATRLVLAKELVSAASNQRWRIPCLAVVYRGRAGGHALTVTGEHSPYHHVI